MCGCAQVHHPNAVQFLGACTKQEPYILVTELMSGGSMADTFRMMKVGAFLQRCLPVFACSSYSQVSPNIQFGNFEESCSRLFFILPHRWIWSFTPKS